MVCDIQDPLPCLPAIYSSGCTRSLEYARSDALQVYHVMPYLEHLLRVLKASNETLVKKKLQQTGTSVFVSFVLLCIL